MVSRRRASIDPSVLSNVDDAVREIARVDMSDSDVGRDARAAARKHLARALSKLLSRPNSKSNPQVRRILEGLVHLLEVRVDLQALLALQQEVYILHVAVAHRVEASSLLTEVFRIGPHERKADFHRTIATSPTTTLGLLGTTLAGGATAAVQSAVMAGALSVAVTGMKGNLKAGRALTVLDRALKHALVEPVPVAMLAWHHDAEKHELSFATAGHRLPWRVHDGQFESLRAMAGEPLGAATRTYRDSVVGSAPGDLLVGFTQGVFEQDDTDGHPIRESNLRIALMSAAPTASDSIRLLRQRLGKHRRLDEWQSEGTVVVASTRVVAR